jgi:hypothetical protein
VTVIHRTKGVADRAKAARAARNRRHYIRRKEHKRVVPVELEATTLNLLQRLSWLNERDADDPAAVARAVESLLRASAKV